MPKHVHDLLTAYVHGELHGDTLECVERHLRDCQECRSELERERAVHSVLCSAKPLKAREGLWDAVEHRLIPQVKPRKTRYSLALACCTIAMAAVALVSLRSKPSGEGYRVLETSGKVTVANETVQTGALLQDGQALCTAPESNTRFAIGDFGEVVVKPDSQVELISSGPEGHRLRLNKGELSAQVLAPPRLFVIETPSADAVDLGCAYTLRVDDYGDTHLTVITGWVALERIGADSIVPAGWTCITRNGVLGTPTRLAAPAAVRKAFESFDLGGGDQALKEALEVAQPDDALGLWHLLARTEGAARRDVYDRLNSFVPSPEGCRREAVLDLDRGALEQWREAIAWQGVKEIQLPFGLGAIPNPNESKR
ncbi:MAG TPA: zf-HC2 domain-containing protein [Fimbriimonas sp.]|nr:zf-HC2 domain-containing protein [Fimbriimonas sp.]